MFVQCALINIGKQAKQRKKNNLSNEMIHIGSTITDQFLTH